MIIDKILEELGADNVIFVCKTGAALFCQNCKDEDYVAVVKQRGRKRLSFENVDVFLYTYQEFDDFAHNKVDGYAKAYSVLIPLATGENVLYGTNPLKGYNWFERKEQVVQALLHRGEFADFNPRVTNLVGDELCLKQSVWLFASYFALVNQSVAFTDEQRSVLQKCHDNLLPRSEVYALKKKLEKFLEKGEQS